MSEILKASRGIGTDGNIRYIVESEPTEYLLGNRRRLHFVWDTGAFISVLSVSNFIKDTESTGYKKLVKSIDEDTEYIDYNSVSGSGKGVLRMVKNLRIHGLLIKSFYFLLVKDVKRIVDGEPYYAGVSLLGADFIDFCHYAHDVEGDITVSGFDSNKYTLYHNSYRYKNSDMQYWDLFSAEADISPVEAKSDSVFVTPP